MADGPFTEQDLKDLEERILALDEVDALIRKSERAGIDVSDRKKQSTELRAQLLRLKQAFFTGP